MSSMNFYSCNEDMAKLFLFLLWNKAMVLDGIDSTSEVSAMLYLLHQFTAFLKNIEWHSDDQAVSKPEVLEKKPTPPEKTSYL